jgi:hypothetical protein
VAFCLGFFKFGFGNLLARAGDSLATARMNVSAVFVRVMMGAAEKRGDMIGEIFLRACRSGRFSMAALSPKCVLAHLERASLE